MDKITDSEEVYVPTQTVVAIAMEFIITRLYTLDVCGS